MDVQAGKKVGRSNRISVDSQNGIHLVYRDDGPSPLKLNAIGGVWPNVVFAVGNGGTVLRYDGQTWNNVDIGSSWIDLEDVWAADEAHVWLAGDLSTLFHFDGSTWQPVEVGKWEGDTWIDRLWGRAANDLYAAGGGWNEAEYGVVLHYDGSDWQQVLTTTTAINDLWGIDNTLYAVGDNLILQHSGDLWQSMALPQKVRLRAIWGRSATDIFAVGDSGTILHFDGQQWSTQESGLEYDDLVDIWGNPNSTDVYTVSEYGELLHYGGEQWQKADTQGTTAPYYLSGVWGSASPTNELFLVGGGWENYGQILHRNGTAWERELSATLKYATTTSTAPACVTEPDCWTVYLSAVWHQDDSR